MLQYLMAAVRAALASLGIDVLEGGKLPSTDPFSCPHHPFQVYAIEGGAVALPGSDIACQDVLHSAGVEPREDVMVHSNLSQLS